jgi:radical SAM superfamily enzyme YgiQ (UPF0313 family)
MYIASGVESTGHQVRIIDQAALSLSNGAVLDRVKRWDPDLVGLSILCQSFGRAKMIASELKLWNPNVKIVCGNYLPTFYASRMIEKYPWVDICVRGEGEETFKELVAALERGNLGDVAGISFRLDGHVMENPDRGFIVDLDRLPFPNRKLVPDVYRNRIAGIDISSRKFTTMVTSRGCPYSCTFCACSAFTRQKFRARSVDNIMAEMSELANQGYKEILFVDDNFTLNKKQVIDLCNRIRQERLNIAFICDGRANSSNLALYSEMHRARFEILMFGFESGVQRVLNTYDKKITPVMIENAVNTARKAGIDILVGSFLIGGLDETYTEAIATLDFIKRLDIDFPQLIFTRALPGTRLFNYLVEKSIIDEEAYWETGVDLINLPDARMKRSVITPIMRKKMFEFFSSSHYWTHSLGRVLSSKRRMSIFRNHLNPRDIQHVLALVRNPLPLF